MTNIWSALKKKKKNTNNDCVDSELNLAVAAHISDRITDQVIESLSASYKALIGECEIRTRSSTPDVLRPSAGSTSSTGGSIIGVGTGGMSLSITTGTPLTERTSLAMDEEEEPRSNGRVERASENDNHPLLSKSIGRLCVEDESPMVSAFSGFSKIIIIITKFWKEERENKEKRVKVYEFYLLTKFYSILIKFKQAIFFAFINNGFCGN